MLDILYKKAVDDMTDLELAASAIYGIANNEGSVDVVAEEKDIGSSIEIRNGVSGFSIDCGDDAYAALDGLLMEFVSATQGTTMDYLMRAVEPGNVLSIRITKTGDNYNA